MKYRQTFIERFDFLNRDFQKMLLLVECKADVVEEGHDIAVEIFFHPVDPGEFIGQGIEFFSQVVADQQGTYPVFFGKERKAGVYCSLISMVL